MCELLIMFTHQVYFSPVNVVSHESVVEIVDRFARDEMKRSQLVRYELSRFTNKGCFPDLYDYQFTANYPAEAAQNAAIKDLGSRYKDEPHASLMGVVKDLEVAFSERIEERCGT